MSHQVACVSRSTDRNAASPTGSGTTGESCSRGSSGGESWIDTKGYVSRTNDGNLAPDRSRQVLEIKGSCLLTSVSCIYPTITYGCVGGIVVDVSEVERPDRYAGSHYTKERSFTNLAQTIHEANIRSAKRRYAAGVRKRQSIELEARSSALHGKTIDLRVAGKNYSAGRCANGRRSRCKSHASRAWGDLSRAAGVSVARLADCGLRDALEHRCRRVHVGSAQAIKKTYVIHLEPEQGANVKVNHESRLSESGRVEQDILEHDAAAARIGGRRGHQDHGIRGTASNDLRRILKYKGACTIRLSALERDAVGLYHPGLVDLHSLRQENFRVCRLSIGENSCSIEDGPSW